MFEVADIKAKSATSVRLRRRAVVVLLITLILLSMPGDGLLVLSKWLSVASPVSSGANIPFDKLVHALMFSGCTWVVLRGWPGKTSVSLALLVLFAAVTEIIQYFVPDRSASFHDFLADCFGIVLAYFLCRSVRSYWGLSEIR